MAPQPPQALAAHGIMAFVLLAQHLNGNERSVLISMADGQAVNHVAVITAPEVTRHALIIHAGLHARCFEVNAATQCWASLGSFNIGDAQPFAARNGDGFVIVVVSLSIPADPVAVGTESATVPQGGRQSTPPSTHGADPSAVRIGQRTEVSGIADVFHLTRH